LARDDGHVEEQGARGKIGVAKGAWRSGRDSKVTSQSYIHSVFMHRICPVVFVFTDWIELHLEIVVKVLLKRRTALNHIQCGITSCHDRKLRSNSNIEG
jgi:hypothetical protein